VVFRLAGEDDVPAIRRISLALGQAEEDSGSDAEYVQFLLATGTVMVAETASGSSVIAWGAVKQSRGRSMLTDLFVDPDHQARGVGAGLLRRLWPNGPQEPARFTFSSRHPAALPIYARAGLAPSWPLLYMSGDRRSLAGPDGSAHLEVRQVDAGSAAAADMRLASAGRADVADVADIAGLAADYRWWGRGRLLSGLIVLDGARPVAAGVATRSGLAHLTCPDERNAAPAVIAALLALDAPEVSLCLPGPHPAVRDLLEAGFRIDDYDISMSTPDVSLASTWVYSPGLG
jgi:GNAT superfamily N-acetyltransferase